MLQINNVFLDMARSLNVQPSVLQPYQSQIKRIFQEAFQSEAKMKKECEDLQDKIAEKKYFLNSLIFQEQIEKLTDAVEFFKEKGRYWNNKYNRIVADFQLQKNLIHFKTTTIERLNMRLAKMQECVDSNGLVIDAKLNTAESLSFLKLDSAKQVLILGEEDFSFTRAIARFFPKDNIVTTAFHPRHDLSEVGNDFAAFVGVDATLIPETLFPQCRFDRIFFMFPWPVDYHSQNPIDALRDLLSCFLQSARDCLLDEDSMIIVALYGMSQIEGVNMETLSKECGFSRCEAHGFGQMWETVLKPLKYSPWIPGATDSLISQRSVIYSMQL